MAKAVEDVMAGRHMGVSVCLARVSSAEEELAEYDSETTGKLWEEEADMFNRECFGGKVLELLEEECGE